MVTVILVWRFETNRKISSIEIPKPSKEALFEIKEAMGKIPVYAEDSPLNSVAYMKKKALQQCDDEVICFCF